MWPIQRIGGEGVSENLLEIRGLKVHFDTLDGPVEALNSVDLDVKRKQVMGLVGESGCGKSVTSLVTIGLATCEVDEGSVKYEGEELVFQEPESTKRIKGISSSIVVISVLMSIFGFFWMILINPLHGMDLFLGSLLVSAAAWGGGFYYSSDSRKHERFMRWVRGNEISMIFQEPMTALNPLYSVEKQISEVMREHNRLVEPETPMMNRIGQALVSPFTLFYRTIEAKPKSSTLIISILAFVVAAHRLGFAESAKPLSLAFIAVFPIYYLITFGTSGEDISGAKKAMLGPMEGELSAGVTMDRINPISGTKESEYVSMPGFIVNPLWEGAVYSMPGVFVGGAVSLVVYLMLWMPFSSLMGLAVVCTLLALPVIIYLDFLRLDPAHSRQVSEILEDVRIPNPAEVVKMYPHELSGGMRQRVMIGMMMSCEPKLLIADEPTTALDVTIQAQILKLMRDLRDEMETSILLITHDLGVIAGMCDEVTVMYAGRVVERASVDELFANPLHAYTRGLIACTPNIESTRKSILPSIPGQVANPSDFVNGCRFCQRMERTGETVTIRPEMIEHSAGHWVEACPICLDADEDKWE
jgi:oligopeptide/dipeptide ABC transporter ATP-binding protein